jgi:hypothetical protein
MRTRTCAVVLFASVFCLAIASHSAAQTQGFQAGFTVGAKGGCVLRTDCGPGFTMGWFLNGDRSATPLPIDAQAEMSIGAQGMSERQSFARAALLLRLKSSSDDFDQDPSPRLHLLIGPQIELRNTAQLAGVGGRPDLRLALGADLARRRTIVELRYTAHIGVRQETQPVVIVSQGPGQPGPPKAVSTPRSSLVFRDGAVVLTIGFRVGG